MKKIDVIEAKVKSGCERETGTAPKRMENEEGKKKQGNRQENRRITRFVTNFSKN